MIGTCFKRGGERGVSSYLQCHAQWLSLSPWIFSEGWSEHRPTCSSAWFSHVCVCIWCCSAGTCSCMPYPGLAVWWGVPRCWGAPTRHGDRATWHQVLLLTCWQHTTGNNLGICPREPCLAAGHAAPHISLTLICIFLVNSDEEYLFMCVC